MNNYEITQLIELGQEFRNVEFKQGEPWGTLKIGITKAILSMSNIKDGGNIVIGMEEKGDHTFEPTGISVTNLETFNIDDIKEFVANYADPYVNFNIKVEDYDSKKFIIINISEFEELPVICKKPYQNILKAGVIYTRSKGNKPESIEVPSHIEMREIIEMAIDKANRKLIERGYAMKNVQSSEQLFGKQAEDFQ